jgi:outer membrane receptor protein involved in Fe transport
MFNLSPLSRELSRLPASIRSLRGGFKPTLLAISLLLDGRLAAQSTTPAATEEQPVVELPKFVVDSSRDVGYQATNTASVSRLSRPLKDIPQSISILNEEFMRDVGVLDFSQAVQYSTNINFQIANADTNFTIRGLTSRSFFVNFLTRVTPTDSYMTERIEVVHGPASVIYGQQDSGGIVNTITKRARLNQTKTSVDFTVGEYDMQRATFDTNIAMGKNQALRVAGLHHTQDNNRAFAELDREGIYADYLWQFNPTTSFRFSGESGFDHRTPFTGILTVQQNNSPLSVAADLTLLPQEYAQSVQGPDARSNLDYFFYTAALTKSLFDNRLNIELTVSESMRNRNQRWGPTMKSLTRSTTTVAPLVINGYQVAPGYGVNVPSAPQQWQWVGLDERFRFYRLQAAWQLPDLGGKHILTFGGSYEPNDYPIRSVTDFLYLTPTGSPRGAQFGAAANQRLPYTAIMPGGMRFPDPILGKGLYRRPGNGFILGKTVKAGFAMLASDWGESRRLKTLVGFRYDDMFNDNATQGFSNDDVMSQTGYSFNHIKQWSKSIGAVYAITPALNATVNYGTSLWPNVNQFDINQNLFGPTQGESFEVGLKTVAYDGRLSAGFTYFDMKQVSTPLSIPAALLIKEFGSATPSRSVAGSVRSKGFEFEMVANPTPQWTLRAGVGNADPVITNDLPQFGYPKDKSLPGVTRYTGTFFTRYTFTRGSAKGWFLGGGFNYRSRNYAGYIDTDNDNVGDSLESFGGYTTFDFLAGYSFKVGAKSRLTFRANLRNAFDRSYIVATDINFAGYGDARQFTFTTGLDF